MNKLFSKQSFNFLAYQGLNFISFILISVILFSIIAIFAGTNLKTFGMCTFILLMWHLLEMPYLIFYTFLTYILLRKLKKTHITFNPKFIIINAILFSVIPVIVGYTYLKEFYSNSGEPEFFMLLITLPITYLFIILFTFVPYLVFMIKERKILETIEIATYTKNQFSLFMTLLGTIIYLLFCFSYTYFGMALFKGMLNL